MHFNGSVLVEVDDNVVSPHWREKIPCPPPFDIRVIESNNPIESVIDRWLKQYGRQWVDEFTGSGDNVNCPDGTLKPGDVNRNIPTTATPDMWYCKISEEVCPIQALIPTDDEEAFLNGCNVEQAAEDIPEDYKKDLFQTVSDEEFTGEHHMAGREPCWHCQQKQVDEDLYDPWALTTIHSHLDESTIERKKKFRRAGLESFVALPICADCFLELPDSFSGIEFSELGVDFERYKTVPYHIDFS